MRYGLFCLPSLNLIEQRSKWVGRKRSYFWGQLWSVILEVTKPVMLKEACLSFHIQDMIMGLRVRTERIQSNVQVSEGWCQDCISWAMLSWVHGWRYYSLEVGDWFSWLSRIPSSVGVPDSAWLGGEEVTWKIKQPQSPRWGSVPPSPSNPSCFHQDHHQ